MPDFALVVRSDGTARFGGAAVRAALGRGGVAQAKREGDGATPLGRFACRGLLWRADRLPLPVTGLPVTALSPDDGWCDDPADPAYNRRVRLPHRARHESLWRPDSVYDLIVPLGYNDDPVVAGSGSAIFLHLARAGYPPTEGCVALACEDLLAFLAEATPATQVIVTR